MKIFTVIAALAALLIYGLSLSAVPADAANGHGTFCRQAQGTDTLACNYRSMAACKRDFRSAGDTCIPTPRRR